MERVRLKMTTAQQCAFPLRWRMFSRIDFHPQLLSGEGLGIRSSLLKDALVFQIWDLASTEQKGFSTGDFWRKLGSSESALALQTVPLPVTH